MKKRKLLLGANDTLILIGVLLVVFAVNLIASAALDRFPNLKADLSTGKLSEVSATTRSVVEAIDKDVNIYYLTRTDVASANSEVTDMIGNYRAINNRIHFETKNYMTDPNFAAKYNTSAFNITDGSLIVECDDDPDDNEAGRYRIITNEAIYVSEFDYQTYQNNTYFNLEEELTNALNFVTLENDYHVYFVTGHDELDQFSSYWSQVFASANIECANLDLKLTDVPEDADVVMALGAQKDYTPEEIDRLDAYFERGGKVQMSLDPGVDYEVLGSYLFEEWGIDIGTKADVVRETDADFAGNMGDGTQVFIPQMSQTNSVTSVLVQNNVPIYVSYNIFRPIATDEVRMLAGSSDENLLYTTESGALYDENGTNVETGSFSLARLVKKPVGETFSDYAQLLIGGSSYIWVPSGDGNYFFVELMFEDMSRYESTMLSIEAKDTASKQTMILTNKQMWLYAALFVIIIPLLVILWGIIVWLRRRHL